MLDIEKSSSKSLDVDSRCCFVTLVRLDHFRPGIHTGQPPSHKSAYYPTPTRERGIHINSIDLKICLVTGQVTLSVVHQNTRIHYSSLTSYSFMAQAHGFSWLKPLKDLKTPGPRSVLTVCPAFSWSVFSSLASWMNLSGPS